MDGLTVKTTDIFSHVIQIGIDVYPPVDSNQNMTRLNLFAEEVRNRWPTLFRQATVQSGAQFTITTRFGSNGPAVEHPVVVLTQRGPVVTFPLHLPEVGAIGVEAERIELATDLRHLFFESIPNLQCMRIGLVRDLLFDTGDVYPLRTVTPGQDSLAGAQLVGGSRLTAFRDAICNIRIKAEPTQYEKSTALAGLGQTVRESKKNALHVVLDVNNHQISPLQEADIDKVMTRALAIWPDELLRFINGSTS